MVEDQPTAEVAVAPTEEELTAELEKALASKDFKQVAAVSRKIDQTIKAKEKAEQAEKVAALDAMRGKVKTAYAKAMKPIVESGDLDAADGIWISQDFGEGEQGIVVRLMKSAPRAARAGGGGGKKFDISTDDMLSRHGQEEYKDGLTFQQAHESSTDKNWRYAIRQKLLKKEGII